MKQAICRILARIVVGISLPVMGQAMAQAAPVGENLVATSEQPRVVNTGGPKRGAFPEKGAGIPCAR